MKYIGSNHMNIVTLLSARAARTSQYEAVIRPVKTLAL